MPPGWGIATDISEQRFKKNVSHPYSPLFWWGIHGVGTPALPTVGRHVGKCPFDKPAEKSAF